MDPASSVRRLTVRYLAVLVVLVVLITGGQTLIVLQLLDQENDSRVVNIAGRQRALSLQLTKTALELAGPVSTADADSLIREMEDTLELWASSHRQLLEGAPEAGLPPNRSALVEREFAALQPFYDAVRNSARRFLGAIREDPEALITAEAKGELYDILANVRSFYQRMNAIVFELDREAKERVNRVILLSSAVWGGVVLILIIQGVVIFRPATRRIANILQQVRQSESQQANLARELARKNRDLDKALEDAQGANRSKAVFLANMSHEIRTPLNGVIGMTNVLADSDLTPDQHEQLEVIRKSGSLLLNIINDVLDFSKIEAGHIDLNLQTARLTDSIESVLDLFASTAGEKDLRLYYTIDPDCPGQVRTDPNRLQQVLSNLFGNAVKFTRVGSVSVRLAARPPRCRFYSRDAEAVEPVEEGTPRVYILVEDTGIGISPDQQGSLFRSFHQVQQAAGVNFGGTGLGLAISRRLVELMGGRVGLTSQVDVGSTFVVELPAVAPGQDQAASRALPRPEQPFTGWRADIRLTDQRLAADVETVLATWGMHGGGERRLVVTGPEQLTDLAAESSAVPVVVLKDARQQVDGNQPDHLPVESLRLPLKPGNLLATLNRLLTDLSAWKEAGEAGKAADASTAPSGVAAHTERPILIVEDNAVNLRIASLMLQRLGYRTDGARDGEEAIRKVGNQVYPLILMDIQMPGKDGYETTQIIRKELDLKDQPLIVALTASATLEERKRCLSSGMDGFVTKPIDTGKLKDALNLLNTRRPVGQTSESE
ncbi:MAG: response regulator [Opitutales bacterium]